MELSRRDLLSSILGAPFVAASLSACGEDDPAPAVEGTILGPRMELGHALRDGVSAMGQGDQCTMIGLGTRNSAMLAALANGALAEALQFDDTHNETIIHATSPTVAALVWEVGGYDTVIGLAVAAVLAGLGAVFLAGRLR